MDQRQTIQQIEASQPNTAASMRKAGLVAQITYEHRGGIFQKLERADGTFTAAVRVA